MLKKKEELPMMSEPEKSARLLGERLKTIRKKMELKQSVFARLIGTSDDTLSLIERGLSSPRLDMLYKISEHLKMPIGELLDFQEKPKAGPAANKPLSALNLYLKTKSPDEVRWIHDLARNVLNKAPAIYSVMRCVSRHSGRGKPR
ncbi:MAG: helix-turn-helix transcriptional regulator [Planctomycetota bacterium]